MPKGEFDTPGPFHLNGQTIRGNGFRVAVISDLDEAEYEELIGLLNKGTHFDEMLDMLHAVLANATEYTGHDLIASIEKTIAKAAPTERR